MARVQLIDSQGEAHRCNVVFWPKGRWKDVCEAFALVGISNGLVLTRDGEPDAVYTEVRRRSLLYNGDRVSGLVDSLRDRGITVQVLSGQLEFPYMSSVA